MSQQNNPTRTAAGRRKGDSALPSVFAKETETREDDHHAPSQPPPPQASYKKESPHPRPPLYGGSSSASSSSKSKRWTSASPPPPPAHAAGSPYYPQHGASASVSSSCAAGAPLLWRVTEWFWSTFTFAKERALFAAYQQGLPYVTVVRPPPSTLREYMGHVGWWLLEKACYIVFCYVLFGPLLLLLHVLLVLADMRQRKRWKKHQLNWKFTSEPHVRPLKYPTAHHHELPENNANNTNHPNDSPFIYENYTSVVIERQKQISSSSTGDSAATTDRHSVSHAPTANKKGKKSQIYADGTHPLPLAGWHLRCEDGRQRWIYGAALAEEEEGNELGREMLTGDAQHHNSFHKSNNNLNNNNNNQQEDEEENGIVRPREDLLKEALRKRRFVELYQLGLTPPSAPKYPHLYHAQGADANENDATYLKEKEKEERELQGELAVEEGMEDGIRFLLKLQDPFSGHWPNDYSGCMFLTPGLIFAEYIIAEGDISRMFSCDGTHCHIKGKQHYYSSLNQRHVFKHRQSGGGEGAHTSKAQPRIEKEPCLCGVATRQEMVRYLRNYQNADGGWGQHTEGHSTMLGTVLNYVALRLLGIEKEDAQAAHARSWILAHGGAVCTPFWGKMWLILLNLFSYDGVNPLPPEMMWLPRWVPFHYGRAWCHSRVIAIPFSYFYGLRWQSPLYRQKDSAHHHSHRAGHPQEDACLLEELRDEIYVQPYREINFSQYRYAVPAEDLYTPTSGLFRFAMAIVDKVETYVLRCGWLAPVRQRAIETCWRHMAYDDENTHFICLGPVNKSLNFLATYIREGRHSPRFKLHQDRVADYLYCGPWGIKMNGYNGSQLWDTSFAVQSICACRREQYYGREMQLAHAYCKTAQVLEDPIDKDAFYRHRTRGAWNFSTSPQGWQVSDCTAEGLRVMLLLGTPYNTINHYPEQRVFDAVEEILSLRNTGSGADMGDGGWASYEPTRAPHYCELLNCAELFKDVMVEYSYAECSSSCIHSLALFRQRYPHYPRMAEVNKAIREGIACVLRKQDPTTGSIYGSWAVCYTYGAWLVADALRVSGELADMANHPHCQHLIHFLLRHQNADDGGWGEDVNACVRQTWVDNPEGSQVVNTAWAVMAIMHASGADYHPHQQQQQKNVNKREAHLLHTPNAFLLTTEKIQTAVERGIRFLLARQLQNGDWSQERISGVFNGNNPIHYPGYKNTMPVWALGIYQQWRKAYY